MVILSLQRVLLSAWNVSSETLERKRRLERGLGLELGLELERRACPPQRDREGLFADARDRRAAVTVSEGDTALSENRAASGRVAGVTCDRLEGVSPQTFVVFSVGSGTYRFVWNAQ